MFSIYASILSEYSPNTVYTFRAFRDDFEYRKEPYIRRILHIRLNTFRAFSKYA